MLRGVSQHSSIDTIPPCRSAWPRPQGSPLRFLDGGGEIAQNRQKCPKLHDFNKKSPF